MRQFGAAHEVKNHLGYLVIGKKKITTPISIAYYFPKLNYKVGLMSDDIGRLTVLAVL